MYIKVQKGHVCVWRRFAGLGLQLLSLARPTQGCARANSSQVCMRGATQHFARQGVVSAQDAVHCTHAALQQQVPHVRFCLPSSTFSQDKRLAECDDTAERV